jgi:hypothetical protein
MENDEFLSRLRAASEELLQKHAAKIQQELNAFAVQKAMELIDSVSKGQLKFLEDQQRRLPEVDKYRDIPMIYERNLQSIENGIKLSLESTDKVLNTGLQNMSRDMTDAQRKEFKEFTDEFLLPYQHRRIEMQSHLEKLIKARRGEGGPPIQKTEPL